MRGQGESRLAADLERLAGMDLTGLRRRWRMVFGRSPPEALSRTLLHRILAYRVQAQALGDLDRETIRLLGRAGEGEAVPLPDPAPTRPGTLLVREWDGALHRVMALKEGYAWNGRTFPSLSAVALAITGTRWNGPRFFGLRGRGGLQEAGSRVPGSRDPGRIP